MKEARDLVCMAPPRMISTRHSHSATSDSNRHQAITKQQRLSQILNIVPSQNLQNPIDGFVLPAETHLVVPATTKPPAMT